jgi:hypothetical protein
MNIYSPSQEPSEFFYEMKIWLKENPLDLSSYSKCSIPPWNKGLPITESAIKNFSIRWNNPTQSEETKRKISEANIGEKNGMYGKTPWNKGLKCPPITEEQKKKQSETMKAKKDHITKLYVVCPHCSKQGRKVPMIRWHFDNCRQKSSSQSSPSLSTIISAHIGQN